MKSSHIRSGFALVTVLIVTGIGLLFGAGALLLFRYQCQLRIERQHELEKVYAVRSALNFIRPIDIDIGEAGRPFRFITQSGRNLKLIVKPVERIFPVLGREFDDYPRRHLASDKNVANIEAKFPCPFQDPKVSYQDLQYNCFYDYEYGADYGPAGNVQVQSCITNSYVEMRDGKPCLHYGFVFTDRTATNYVASAVTNNVRWWVNVGMRDTGGWLQEDYGRRYFFKLENYMPNDIIRLCLIRSVTNKLNAAGSLHGWPLSGAEMALVFQVTPADGNSVQLEFSTWKHVGSAPGSIQKTTHLNNDSFSQKYRARINSKCYMGLQIARDRVYLFQIDPYMTERDNVEYDLTSKGCIISSCWEMSEDMDVYNHFAKYYDENAKCWKMYDANDAVANGKRLNAPELRAVFEVEAASKLRPDERYVNAITDFRVTPAYQYDIFLEHPQGVTNRATVAQKIGEITNPNDPPCPVMTYDTHGTENKGFRKDEREAERKRNGR